MCKLIFSSGKKPKKCDLIFNYEHAAYSCRLVRSSTKISENGFFDELYWFERINGVYGILKEFLFCFCLFVFSVNMYDTLNNKYIKYSSLLDMYLTMEP